jgi:diguanylate cyclase (GGDEF)-like protein
LSRHEQEKWDDETEMLEHAVEPRIAELMLALQRSEMARARLAVINAALTETNRQLAALATTDEMTGLANHRRFRERLREEMARRRRNGEALALLVLDVDRFKCYNDAYGHLAGDDALRIVAGILRQCVRDVDLAARYGGEEFAVLLPATDAAAAAKVAERIRSAVEHQEFPHSAITVSIGVSDLALAGEDADALIASADAALYRAKREGRNRVALAIDEGFRVSGC